MNTFTKQEHLDIKHEEDLLSDTKIKIEPQDISEIKIEEEEEEECDKTHEHANIKFEMKPASHCNATIKTVPKMEEGILANLLKRSKDKRDNEEDYDPNIPKETFVKHLERKIYKETAHKAIKCNICNKPFSFKHNPREEMNINTDETSFICTNCSNTFSQKTPQLLQSKTSKSSFLTMNTYTEHQHVHIKDEEDPLSNTKIKIEPQDIVSEIKTEEKEECDETPQYANIKFEMKPASYCDATINIVPKMEEGISVNLFKRSEDNEECQEDYDPIIHKETFVRNLVRKMSKETEHKDMKCNICNKSFSFKHNPNEEININTDETSFICTNCSNTFCQKTPQSVQSKCSKGKKQVICCVCKKEFASKDSLNVHMRIHTGGSVFKCNFCNKSFARKFTLCVHLRTHTGEEIDKCNICSRVFLLKSHYDEHMRAHISEKPFECSFCKKSFSRNVNLIRHMSIHTGERPFVCNFCNKSFSEKYDLRRHISNIHTGEGVRSFKCNLCDMSFYSNHHLVTHTRTHTGERPFTCDTCNKSFSQKSGLVAHVRIHLGLKPFTCRLCRRSFCKKVNLDAHMRTHWRKKIDVQF